MTIGWIPPLLDNGLVGAELWNAVLGLSGQAIPLGQEGASLTFSLTDPPSADAWLASVEIDRVSQPILVHVRDFPFRAIFDVDLSIADLPGLPDGLRQALLEGILGSSFALVSPGNPRAHRLVAQGVAATFPEFARREAQWFAVRLTRPDGLDVNLDVSCDRSIAANLLAEVKLGASPAQAAIAERIRLPADVTIGSLSVSHREIGALEPGAIVVMAEQPAGALNLRIEAILFEFTKAEEGGWRCVGQRSAAQYRSHAKLHGSAGEAVMEEEAGPVGAESVTVADLRITIDFDIGRMMVPLSTVSQWQEGTVLELDPPVPADGLEVTIRANGDVIGSGDVVRIDDRLAVRITRFMLRS